MVHGKDVSIQTTESTFQGSVHPGGRIYFRFRRAGNRLASEAYKAVSDRGLVPFFYQGLQLADTISKVAYDAQFHASHCDVIILAISEYDAQHIAQLTIYKDSKLVLAALQRFWRMYGRQSCNLSHS